MTYNECNPYFSNHTSSTFDYEEYNVPALTTSAFLTSVRTAVEVELMEALEEAETLNAHDPDAQEVPSIYARCEAYGLLNTLPVGVIAPRPVIEPAGDIAFMWDAHGVFLVLAVSGTGLLEWTLVINGKESVGSELLADALPFQLVDRLRASFLIANA